MDHSLLRQRARTDKDELQSEGGDLALVKADTALGVRSQCELRLAFITSGRGLTADGADRLIAARIRCYSGCGSSNVKRALAARPGGGSSAYRWAADVAW